MKPKPEEIVRIKKEDSSDSDVNVEEEDDADKDWLTQELNFGPSHKILSSDTITHKLNFDSDHKSLLLRNLSESYELNEKKGKLEAECFLRDNELSLHEQTVENSVSPCSVC